MKLNLIINCAFCIVNCALLISCASNRPMATTHTERIEEKVMPILVGADTIEIVLSHTDNTEDIKTCLLGRDFAQQKQDHYVKEKSSYVFLSKNTTSEASSNLWETPHSEGVNSVRISSTRGVNISRYETDTTSTLRITLRPDTVFVPYTNHIRSDTIVVPDRICQQKLNHSNMTNIFLILILIAMLMLSVLRAKLV